MRRERRLQEKRKRRAKRTERRRGGSHELARLGFLDGVLSLLRNRAITPSGPPAAGACHSALHYPDLVKADYGLWLQSQPRWSQLLHEFERRYEHGPLYSVPSIADWALEEFFWHGVPGEARHPLDDWLDSNDCRLPPEAREQVRQWKSAQIGVFEIVGADAHTVRLRPCVPQSHLAGAEEFRAICLSICGTVAYQDQVGRRLLTYVAPWNQSEELWCVLGYGMTMPADSADVLQLVLNVSKPDVAAAPWPWRENRGALRKYLAAWKVRDWQEEFSQRVQTPFEAIALLPSGPTRVRVERQVASTSDQARRLGVYFEVSPPESVARGKSLYSVGRPAIYVVGASTIEVLDLRSPFASLFAEYAAYRQAVGQPPGMVGAPTFIQT